MALRRVKLKIFLVYKMLDFQTLHCFILTISCESHFEHKFSLRESIFIYNDHKCIHLRQYHICLYTYDDENQSFRIVIDILSQKSPLAPCPMAGKRCPNHGGGCTRPWATTIVAGIYARCRVMSLVPAYEALCVWKARTKEEPQSDHPPSAYSSPGWNSPDVLRAPPLWFHSTGKEPSVCGLQFSLPPLTHTGGGGM